MAKESIQETMLTLQAEKLRNLHSIIGSAVRALQNKVDEAGKSLTTFLQQLDSQLEALQQDLKTLEEDANNAYLQDMVAEGLKEVVASVTEKYASYEALGSKTALARIHLKILSDLKAALMAPATSMETIETKTLQEVFRQTLRQLAGQIHGTDKRHSCFLSYAWGVSEHEQLVKQLDADLRIAGFEALLDVRNNGAGSSINFFTEEVLNVDTVILVGSKNLLRKYDEGKRSYAATKAARELGDPVAMAAAHAAHRDYIVNQELEMILLKKREKHFSIMPILLDGDLRQCLPPEFANTVPVHFQDWKDERKYCLHVLELLVGMLPAQQAVIQAASAQFMQLLEAKGKWSEEEAKRLLQEQQRLEEIDKQYAKEVFGAAAQSVIYGGTTVPIAPSHPAAASASGTRFTDNVLTDGSRALVMTMFGASRSAAMERSRLHGNSTAQVLEGTDAATAQKALEQFHAAPGAAKK